MTKTKYGFDLDGVICTKLDTWWSNLLWKLFPVWWSGISHRLAKRKCEVIIHPGSIIITGRMWRELEITRNQLQKWGIVDYYLYINPKQLTPDKEKSIRFKIQKIKELGLDVFYEDDEEVINQLKVEIPKLRVIKVS